MKWDIESQYNAANVQWHSNVCVWHECDLRAAPINVRSWESNGLNADVAFGPFMTHKRSFRMQKRVGRYGCSL